MANGMPGCAMAAGGATPWNAPPCNRAGRWCTASPIGSQCRGDIVQVIDFNLGGVNFGGCGFGSWERVAGPPSKPAKSKD